MSVVKYIPYTNRLAKVIDIPGGKRLSEALAEADANLKAISGPCLAGLDAAIERIRELGMKRAASRAELAGVYRSASEIVGLAGVCGLPQLGQAAYSLCELIDAAPKKGCDPKAVGVHIDSMRLLRAGEALSEAQRQSVLDGLTDVVRSARNAD